MTAHAQGPDGSVPRAGRAGFGEGVLSRVAERVYWYAATGVLTTLGTAPTLVLLMLLDRSSGNALLVPLCLVPAVPCWSAGLFALHARAAADGPAPARAFVRGLRLGTRDVLALWVPALAVLGVVATSMAHPEAAGIGGAYAVVLGAVGLGVALWALEALVLATLLSLRTRDVARLALYYLARRPGVTVGVLALLVVAAGTVWFAGEAVLAVLAVVWLGFLRRTTRPVVADAVRRFTA
ncbi:glycosyltransferase [Isoptericola aurantiacus]|uniref:glycosyltransferase n=1 Tax=Isoptericola aurantiacus TaxID=3377839 RepID=UPI00383BE755